MKSVLALLLAAGAAGFAQAQLVYRGDLWPAANAAGLGAAPAAAEVPVGCGPSLLPCASPAMALQRDSEPSTLRWSVELSQLRLAPPAGPTAGVDRQGLNLSLVGRKPLFGHAFSVYGKLGTTYGYAESGHLPGPAAAAFGTGYGLSLGAGVSMDVTRRLSATLGWESHDLRLVSGGRDNVRSTSLGLQYRY